MAVGRHGRCQQFRRVPRRARERQLQRPHRIGLRRGGGQREVGAQRMLLARRNEIRDPVVDADVLRGIERALDIGLGHRRKSRTPRAQDKIARARAGLDQAVVLELAACLQGSGQADVMGAHQIAYRRHALRRGQYARQDGAAIVVC